MAAGRFGRRHMPVRADGQAVPGRVVLNSHARYRINRQWEASLNFNSMFDKTCCVCVGNLLNSSHHGDPRNVMLTLRGSFRGGATARVQPASSRLAPGRSCTQDTAMKEMAAIATM